MYLNVFAVVFLLLAYLSPFINPENFWIISFFGLFFPIFFLLNILFLIFWIFADLKWSLLSLAAMFIGYFHFINFNLPHENIKSDKDINIASFNIMGGWGGKSDKEDLNESAFSNFIEGFEETDIFILQESNPSTNELIREILQQHNVYDAGKGVVIYSKYQILDKGVIEFGTKTNSCLWADLNINGTKVRVYGIHLQSNKITKDANEVVDNPNIQEKKTWIGIRGIFSKYKYALLKRSNQADQIAEHMKNCSLPIIAMGDFNDPSLSYAYATIKNEMQDAFVESGLGLGVTYAGKIPFLRIDYNLMSADFSVKNTSVINSHFSDHYPVISTIIFKE